MIQRKTPIRTKSLLEFFFFLFGQYNFFVKNITLWVTAFLWDFIDTSRKICYTVRR